MSGDAPDDRSAGAGGDDSPTAGGDSGATETDASETGDSEAGDWKVRADERIRTHRTADLTVSVTDADGGAVADVEIRESSGGNRIPVAVSAGERFDPSALVLDPVRFGAPTAVNGGRAPPTAPGCSAARQETGRSSSASRGTDRRRGGGEYPSSTIPRDVPISTGPVGGATPRPFGRGYRSSK